MQLLLALLLQAIYGLRSEQLLLEQLNDNLASARTGSATPQDHGCRQGLWHQGIRAFQALAGRHSHVAQNTNRLRGLAIDGRTIRHLGYRQLTILIYTLIISAGYLSNPNNIQSLTRKLHTV